MTANAEWIRMDAERLPEALAEAVEKLRSAPADLALDFAAVGRIDSKAAGVMEELAGVAAERSVQPVLRGVNSEIYKVLKLLKLTGQFRFVS